MREKLIELIMSSNKVSGFAGGLADYLIANGVRLEEKQATSDKASNWIPVTERLPEEDGTYLVFEKHRYGTQTRTIHFAKDARKVDKYDFHRSWKKVWYEYDSEWGHYTIDDVTHWMPLPQPPKGE